MESTRIYGRSEMSRKTFAAGQKVALEDMERTLRIGSGAGKLWTDEKDDIASMLYCEMNVCIFWRLTKLRPATAAVVVVPVPRLAPQSPSLPAWPLSFCGALLARWCCRAKTPIPTDFTFSAQTERQNEL